MRPRHHDDRSGDDGVPRRAVLATTAALATASFAGCITGDDEQIEAPDPDSLAETDVCNKCSMIIADYPGPSGQTVYTGDVPEERDGHTKFCSIECMLTFDHEQQRVGWDPIVYYVTDYSLVEYRIDDETAEISKHLDADTFADAETLQFVRNSRVRGAMGEAAIPFSSEDDAERLVEEYGGSIADWSDLIGG